MELRDYQTDCLNQIKASRDKGINRQLVALPTGTGKTIVFAHLPQLLSIDRMLVIAHREELLEQAKDKIQRANPTLNIGIEQADRHCSPLLDNVIVASVATLGRKDNPRLKALDPKLWTVIICDEAHHSVAPTYMNVFNHFGVFDNPQSLLVGFTATPRRGDKVGLDSVYQDIVFHRDIREMIEAGWLCPIRGYRIHTNTDLSKVRVSHGDFVDAELSEAVNTDERNKLAVDAYRTYCDGRKALIFCVDKEHSRQMAETFNNAGVSCGVVLGDTPSEERAATLKDLADGKLLAVANCMVLTEGFDLPSLSAIIMSRPTKSGLLYTQCVGRGTRTAPSKTDAIIIDLTDNSYKHTLISLPTLVGLPPDFDLKGKRVTDALSELEEQQRLHPRTDLTKARSLDEARKLIESFDLLKEALQIDEKVAQYSQFIWTPAADGYTLYLKDRGNKLTIRENILGHHEVSILKDGVLTQLSVADNIRLAFAQGDSYLMSNHKEETVLHAQTARWRNDGASRAQIGFLRHLGVSFPLNISKGQASQLIDNALNKTRPR